MNAQPFDTSLQITGQVRSMIYLVDESTMMLTIQANGQTIAARASDQIVLELVQNVDFVCAASVGTSGHHF